jgi:transposase
MNKLDLSVRQQHYLENQSRTPWDAERRVRALTLLAVNEGKPVAEAAQWFRVTRQTIHNWIQGVKKEPIEDVLTDHRGPGRPRLCTPEGSRVLRQALKRSPQAFGYPNTSWTLPLLQQHLEERADLELSRDTLRRQLHEWHYVWKRFRYELIGDPEAEKKSPHLSSDREAASFQRSFGRGRDRSAAVSRIALRLGQARTPSADPDHRAKRQARALWDDQRAYRPPASVAASAAEGRGLPGVPGIGS